MAIVNVTQASKLVGKTRKTIQRYVSIGKLSKVISSDGKEGIDTSELIRVFGEIATQRKNSEVSETDIHNVALKERENITLKCEINLLRELLSAKDAHIESLNKALLMLESRKKDNEQYNKDVNLKENFTHLSEVTTNKNQEEAIGKGKTNIEFGFNTIKQKRRKIFGIF